MPIPSLAFVFVVRIRRIIDAFVSSIFLFWEKVS